MKVYVDTNVLVDFVCNRQGFVEEAKKLFAHGYMEEYELMTSALSVVNAVYIGHKYKHNDIEEYLIKVASFVDVVDLRGQVVVDMLLLVGKIMRMRLKMPLQFGRRQIVL